MQPPGGADDLVISTPERVAFQYPIAGIGSRFLAQAIDLIVFGLLALVIGIAAAAFGAVFHNSQLALLLWLLLSFCLIFGYFLVSEALFGGQTLGKRMLRLRVVQDRGEPIGFSQAAVRNLIRIVDFLPFFYGIGLVALFINGRGKRLGDLAAGTLVVRERERINLYDLAATAQPEPEAAPAAAPSIWSTPVAPSGTPPSAQPAASPRPHLEPALRRLVVAYAGRRAGLSLERREALARSAEAALRRALPALVASVGPLAALDQLAEWEGVTPLRRTPGTASWSLTLGILSIASGVLVFLSPLGVITGIAAILTGGRAMRTVRAAPQTWQGAERARTGRILGIIGLAISGLFVALFVLATVFGALGAH